MFAPRFSSCPCTVSFPIPNSSADDPQPPARKHLCGFAFWILSSILWKFGLRFSASLGYFLWYAASIVGAPSFWTLIHRLTRYHASEALSRSAAKSLQRRSQKSTVTHHSHELTVLTTDIMPPYHSAICTHTLRGKPQPCCQFLGFPPQIPLQWESNGHGWAFLRPRPGEGSQDLDRQA